MKTKILLSVVLVAIAFVATACLKYPLSIECTLEHYNPCKFNQEIQIVEELIEP